MLQKANSFKEIANESDESDQKKSFILKGVRLRDEFLCPITYELLREPVVGSDGHTYERDAIEKWLKTKNISPRNGEVMLNNIITNLNLKKLIQDLISEGGAGLYCTDIHSGGPGREGRTIEVCTERTLIVTCLGPAESEWNQRSFQVRSVGCIGGRGNLNELDGMAGKDIVKFSADNAVSRRHFEISLQESNNTRTKSFYGIRDLGSIGGTFIRISYGERKELHPGMIILLGQHQFTVSSIIEQAVSSGSSNGSARAEGKDDEYREVASLIMSNAEDLLSCVKSSMHSEEKAGELLALEKRLKDLTSRLSDQLHNTSPRFGSQDDTSKSFSGNETKQSSRSASISLSVHSGKVCTLTCFQPEGSPILGKSFSVTSEGGSVGRRLSNAIAICSQVVAADGEVRTINIDNAVSSDHARIEMDQDTGRYFITDGTASKASTNGIWWRLSGPQQESSFHAIKAHDEILIGKSRFQAVESMSILEKVIESTADEK